MVTYYLNEERNEEWHNSRPHGNKVDEHSAWLRQYSCEISQICYWDKYLHWAAHSAASNKILLYTAMSLAERYSFVNSVNLDCQVFHFQRTEHHYIFLGFIVVLTAVLKCFCCNGNSCCLLNLQRMGCWENISGKLWNFDIFQQLSSWLTEFSQQVRHLENSWKQRLHSTVYNTYISVSVCSIRIAW